MLSVFRTFFIVQIQRAFVQTRYTQRILRHVNHCDAAMLILHYYRIPEKCNHFINMSGLTDQEIEHAMNKLNHHPRKTLGYRTPYEVLFKTKVSLTVALGS